MRSGLGVMVDAGVVGRRSLNGKDFAKWFPGEDGVVLRIWMGQGNGESAVRKTRMLAWVTGTYYHHVGFQSPLHCTGY